MRSVASIEAKATQSAYLCGVLDGFCAFQGEIVWAEQVKDITFELSDSEAAALRSWREAQSGE